MGSQIIEVKDKTDWKLFHRVPHEVYRNYPDWITPLESEIEGVFDPQKNTVLKCGEAKCFVLLENNIPCGRIAAFIDRNRQPNPDYTLGGIGFFECVDRLDLARELFNNAESYLKSREVGAIDGLINFGSRDTFWGVLVKGLAPPLYQENYHPPYYKKFLLSCGYQPYEQILTYGGMLEKIPFQRLRTISQRLQQRQPICVKQFSFEQQDIFVKDFCEIYNAAFPKSPIVEAQVHNSLERGKDIIDTKLICLAYYEKRPAAYIILYPDINPLLKNVKGKFNLVNGIWFLLRKKLQKNFYLKGISIGIHPDYQSKGMAALLIDFVGSNPHIRSVYKCIYLTGIVTQNHEIRSIYDKLNFKIDRIHCTYRKALKKEIAIEPFEFIEFK